MRCYHLQDLRSAYGRKVTFSPIWKNTSFRFSDSFTSRHYRLYEEIMISEKIELEGVENVFYETQEGGRIHEAVVEEYHVSPSRIICIAVDESEFSEHG
jgi:hypothetical protein